jgi:predicted dehydrogenase
MTSRNRVGRRQFLKGAGGAALGALSFPSLIPASALGQDGQAAPSDRIRMALIGCGGQGKFDLKNHLGARGAYFTAVCDIQDARRQEAKSIVDKRNGNADCSVTGDFREILNRRDIDAVLVVTQDHWHAAIATAAAKAGKDLYCEKPLGVSVAESRAIVEAVRKHKRVFQTGTQQRSDRKFRFACELALNGYLGALKGIQVAAEGPKFKRTYRKPTGEEPVPAGFDYDMYLGPAPMKPYNAGRHAWPDWYLIWDYCAGFIVNWGVHHLDIANWGYPAFATELCELEFTGSYRNDGLTDNINGWTGEFRLANGLRIGYSDDDNPHKHGIRFEGTEGWVHVDRARITAGPKSLLDVEFKSGDRRLVESTNHYHGFVDCIRTRRDPVSNVESGHQASLLGLIAEISCRLKRKLAWDPKAERFVNDAEADALLTRPMRAPWKLDS